MRGGRKRFKFKFPKRILIQYDNMRYTLKNLREGESGLHGGRFSQIVVFSCRYSFFFLLGVRSF